MLLPVFEAADEVKIIDFALRLRAKCEASFLTEKKLYKQYP
jgi:hypothetical protein